MTCKTNSRCSATELQQFQIRNETEAKAVLLTIHKPTPIEWIKKKKVTTELRFWVNLFILGIRY